MRVPGSADDVAIATLFDGVTAAARPVLASLRGGQLDLHEPDGPLLHSWAVRDLERTDRDVPGESATLRRRGAPERLMIADAALLAALRAAGGRVPTVRAWTGRSWAGVAGAIVAAIAIAGLIVDRLPAVAVVLVPHRVERLWSTGIEAAIGAQERHCDAPAGLAALDALIGRLAFAGGLAQPPRFAVLDNPGVNAFTLPDGRILILRGLIGRASDGDELAGVLAHELGHVLHRDPTREMLRRLEMGMIARGLGWGAGIGSQMAALSYGRRAEAAADASALVTLHRAGLRADGLGRLLAGMAQDGGDVPAFLSDHPSTASRVRRLQVGPAGDTALTPDQWHDVRTICGR